MITHSFVSYMGNIRHTSAAKVSLNPYKTFV